ncbi:MAG: alpha/beta fold hydrolase [Thiobacillus sp.]|nr:alpha/beta fold hydrolase [Thiobacillus sp.]
MRIKLFCLLISLFSTAAQAVVVDLEMRPGISASAEYLIGERSKPAVLLLHGFLQTREFRTVATLANSLRDAGYTVLAPTLSLNIPNRTQTLACEAVHKHSMDEDVAEIARWVNWLKSRGHHTIVLFGHSFGSLQLLAYLNAQPDAAVKAYIGTSLIETRIAPISRSALIVQLTDRAQSRQRALVTQTVSFCKKYTAPPEAMLSYVLWDQARTLMAVKQSPVRMQLIMGDADKMLGHNWIEVLQHMQAPVVLVHGANHFMDAEHEFDLLEHTLDFLQKVPLSQ